MHYAHFTFFYNEFFLENGPENRVELWNIGGYKTWTNVEL